MRVFVTGGTGLLGSHLIEHLRARGHDVVALCRREADSTFLEQLGCAIAEGDVRDDEASLAEAIAGCSHLVHGAGLVYASGEWPKVRAVNVDGTRNVLRAAHTAGVAHAIHISSVAVYGTVAGEVDEDTPIDSPIPRGDLYARSKREAEEVARGIAGKRGLPVTIVRPAAVYGERDRLMAPAIARIVRLPLVPLFGSGENTLPVVYAGNVAVAIATALEARPGGTYDIGLDRPLTQRGLFEMLGAGLGVGTRFVSLPSGLVRLGADLLTRVGVTAPGAEHLPLDRVARLALGENPYPSRRIRRDLGFDPPFEHAVALERTGRWLLNHERGT